MTATRPTQRPSTTSTRRSAAATSSSSGSTTRTPPVLVNTRRVDDVEPAYNSATGQAVQVTLFGSPFQTRTAVDVTALFLQDSYSVQRLTLTGGLRWERLEGYLPEQQSPPSPLFPNLQRSFPAQRDIVNWKTVGPRASATYDLFGDAKTALKASYGRYYYVIATGGAPLDNVNPNANYSEQYAWNDANGDLVWQPGEQTGTPVITAGTTTTVDTANYKRPYTDEFTAGIDREVLPGVGFNATYTYRIEKDIQALANPANPFATTLTTRADAGPDGVTGTGDDTTYQFYDRLSGANPRLVTTDATRRQTYKGLELTVDKRMSNRWQMLAGYTYSQMRFRNVSVDPDPNALLFVNGPVADQLALGRQVGDRPHNFKLTGSYLTPLWDILVGANFLSQSGAPITRYVNTGLTVGGTTNVPVAEPGSDRLPTRTVLDLRVSKSVRMAANRAFDVNVDISNVFNSNVVWDARNLSGTLGFLQAGLPGNPTNTLPQYLSPAAVLAPMNVRFSAAFRF